MKDKLISAIINNIKNEISPKQKSEKLKMLLEKYKGMKIVTQPFNFWEKQKAEKILNEKNRLDLVDKLHYIYNNAISYDDKKKK